MYIYYHNEEGGTQPQYSKSVGRKRITIISVSFFLLFFSPRPKAHNVSAQEDLPLQFRTKPYIINKARKGRDAQLKNPHTRRPRLSHSASTNNSSENYSHSQRFPAFSSNTTHTDPSHSAHHTVPASHNPHQLPESPQYPTSPYFPRCCRVAEEGEEVEEDEEDEEVEVGVIIPVSDQLQYSHLYTYL